MAAKEENNSEQKVGEEIDISMANGDRLGLVTGGQIKRMISLLSTAAEGAINNVGKNGVNVASSHDFFGLLEGEVDFVEEEDADWDEEVDADADADADGSVFVPRA